MWMFTAGSDCVSEDPDYAHYRTIESLRLCCTACLTRMGGVQFGCSTPESRRSARADTVSDAPPRGTADLAGAGKLVEQ